MRILPQLLVIAAIGVVAIPVAARFVPGTRPWLASFGVLPALETLGIIPEDASAVSDGRAPGAGGGTAAQVLAVLPEQQVMRDVVTSIGSARGVQSVDLSFEVSGRLNALKVVAGGLVTKGDVIAELDAEAAGLLVARAQLVLEDAQKTIDRLDLLAQSGTATNLQLQDAELALRTAELGLQSAKRDLADHTLTAPVSGYAGLIEPQIGDLITSSTTITRIEDRSSLIVDFRVPERVAAMIAPGDVVKATAISSRGVAVAGKIVAVDNRVDETSRTLRVQATIANADDSLRAGMAFQIDLEFTGASYPAVDPLSIQWGADGAFVWVVRQDKAVRLPIRILQRNADTVLIEATLEAGDLVVTEGVQSLRPGADVAVAPARS